MMQTRWALCRLVKDPDLTARMGAVGRKYVAARYSWENVTHVYRAAIEEVSALPS
jgi:glycosyltransferase involved in cell wall biosynthesis